MKNFGGLPLLGGITETDTFEPNLLMKALEDMGEALLHHIVLRVHEAEDVFARTESLLKAVVEHCELAHGIVERKDSYEERNE